MTSLNQKLCITDTTSKQRRFHSNTGPTLCWGTSAGVPHGGGRQQAVAMGGRNVGNRQVREGAIVSPRPSLSLTVPLSLSWWPGSPAQRRAVGPQKTTTSVVKYKQNVATTHVSASSSKNKCERGRRGRGFTRRFTPPPAVTHSLAGQEAVWINAGLCR